jgi:hypothetical protein
MDVHDSTLPAHVPTPGPLTGEQFRMPLAPVTQQHVLEDGWHAATSTVPPPRAAILNMNDTNERERNMTLLLSETLPSPLALFRQPRRRR